MAKLPTPTGGKTTWIVGGVLVLAVVWFLMKRGGGPTVIPGSAGGSSDAQLQAASQGFQALASVVGAVESAKQTGAAQLAIVQAEADAAVKAAALQAGATTAAADRYASAQKGAYVWGTIRDIGVTVIPYLFGRGGSSGSSTWSFPRSSGGFGGGVQV